MGVTPDDRKDGAGGGRRLTSSPRVVRVVASILVIAALGAAPDAAFAQRVASQADDGHTASPWSVPPAVDVTAPVELAARVTAPHWFVLETATGHGIVGHDHATRRPVASAVKIATALTVIRRAELAEEVVIGEDNPVPLGASGGLRPGQTWTIETLLLALIARSGNDAAEVLAMHIGGSREGFMDLMRADLADIGLSGVVVSDPSGLDDLNRFSAHELAMLGSAALADGDLRPLFARFDLELPDQPPSTSRNVLLEDYPGATGIKTGFTQAAGNVLVGSAKRADREIVAVVLGSDDDPARFEDVARLLDHAFGTSRLHRLTIDLQVRHGHGTDRWSMDQVPLTAPADAEIVMRPVWPTYRPDGAVPVHVFADGDEIGVARARPQTSVSQPDRPLSVGHALADGIYAALRRAADVGGLR